MAPYSRHANRTSDNGLYVDTFNRFAVFPNAGIAQFTNNAYHDVVLSNNNGVITYYLDGGAQNKISTPLALLAPGLAAIVAMRRRRRRKAC